MCKESSESIFAFGAISYCFILSLHESLILFYSQFSGCHYPTSYSYSTLFALPLHLSKRCLVNGGLSYGRDKYLAVDRSEGLQQARLYSLGKLFIWKIVILFTSPWLTISIVCPNSGHWLATTVQHPDQTHFSPLLHHLDYDTMLSLPCHYENIASVMVE